jgi:hypothetical protein
VTSSHVSTNAHRVLSLANVVARGVLEAGIVAALGYWGFTAGPAGPGRVVLAILAPACVFGFWAVVDFRSAGSHAEALRLAQELAVTAVAGAALYTAEQPVLAWLLVGLSVVHHAAVYLLGERLLDR